jgi:hypothetical protein
MLGKGSCVSGRVNIFPGSKNGLATFSGQEDKEKAPFSGTVRFSPNAELRAGPGYLRQPSYVQLWLTKPVVLEPCQVLLPGFYRLLYFYDTAYPMSDTATCFEGRSLKPFTISHTATVIWIGSKGIAISPMERYPSNIINVTPMN